MKVKDLKEKLKDIDDDKKVYLEGCDCNGEWNGKITLEDNRVLLGRNF